MKEENCDSLKGKSTGELIPLIVHAVLFMLGLWGCLAIYNATVYGNQPFHFAGRQFVWLIVGMMILYFSSKIPFKAYVRYAPLAAVIFYVPLVLVLFLGVKVNGMRGWFEFGSVFVQPSEIAKPLFILSLCWLACRNEAGFKTFLVLIFAAAVWIVPIILEPDFGTAFVYVTGLGIICLISGLRYSYLSMLCLAAIILLVLVMAENPYVFSRLSGFLDPQQDPRGSGWHILQFHYALAHGGFWGTSWGNCIWANSYLPLSYSDSAFAALTEAIGFAGVLPIILGFAVFAYSGLRLSENAEGGINKMFITAMTSLVVLQAFLHISVNVGLVPPTGITLPLFSYGGSSLVSTMFAAGIILSAAKKETATANSAGH